MGGKFADLVEIVGVGSEGDGDARLDAEFEELGRRFVRVEVDLRRDLRFAQHSHHRVEERGGRVHASAAEDAEGMGEDLDAA